tara:strand:+ start:13571 stop:14173 length:603 start_codon:yes stop_codon:yes gene_type:complete
MNSIEFLKSIEESYSIPYSEGFSEAITAGTMYFDSEVLSRAATRLCLEYSTLPTPKNVLKICYDEKENCRKEGLTPSYSKNSLTPDGLKVSNETYDSWFKELRINISGEVAYITPPTSNETNKNMGIYETYIMEKHLVNLETALGKIKKVAWKYFKSNSHSGEYRLSDHDINQSKLPESEKEEINRIIKDAITTNRRNGI